MCDRASFESDFVARVAAVRCGSPYSRYSFCSLPFPLSLPSPSSLGPLAGPSSCCLDLPFYSDRLLNLPLIPWLSRFFSSFFLSFPSFHLFVVPVLLLLLLPPPSPPSPPPRLFFLLHLASFSLLSPPFCYISPLRRSFAGSSPGRDPRRQVSNCLGSRERLLRRETVQRSRFLRPRVLLATTIVDISLFYSYHSFSFLIYTFCISIIITHRHRLISMYVQ